MEKFDKQIRLEQRIECAHIYTQLYCTDKIKIKPQSEINKKLVIA